MLYAYDTSKFQVPKCNRITISFFFFLFLVKKESRFGIHSSYHFKFAMISSQLLSIQYTCALLNSFLLNFQPSSNSYKNGQRWVQSPRTTHNTYPPYLFWLWPHTHKQMAGSTVKVAAICGSLRKASYNRGLIRCGM